MSQIVLLTDAWGPKYGGINSFNMDLAKALGALLRSEIAVTCVVLDATVAEIEDARRHNVRLIPIGQNANDRSVGLQRAQDVAKLVLTGDDDPAKTWWLGHDIITGELAVALPTVAGCGQSAVIHHMSYIDYFAFKHGVGTAAKEMFDRQKEMFAKVDKLFAVGPLLRERLADMLAIGCEKVCSLVPGLADIEAAPLPNRFSAITFGRLDPASDRIKQGRLAVAGFASAVEQCRRNSALPAALRDQPLLKVIGLAEAGSAEEQELRSLTAESAAGVIPLLTLPYDDDRPRVFDELRRSSLAMMLSWHEGFGLTGWEAVAAEVPLLVSKNSGVYRLIDDTLENAGVACLKALDVRGQEPGPDGEAINPEDRRDVAAAVLEIAADPERAKRGAKRLRVQLMQSIGCTWAETARTLASSLGIEIPRDKVAAIPAVPVQAVPPAETPTAAGLLEIPVPRWQAGRGLAESQLLRAEEACVPFHASRQGLLDEVMAWATAESAFDVAVQLRIGPGGSGKTRLLLEACRNLADRGWEAGFLRRRPDSDLKGAIKQLVAVGRPILIVIDYAETRRTEVVTVLEAAQDASKGRRIRIMLLARAAGEWWDRLAADHPTVEPILTGRATTGPYPMPPVPHEGQGRETVFREALQAFATRLERGATGIMPPDLSASHFREPLFIHLSALAALFGERPETAVGLLDASLRRERKYWHQVARDRGLPAALDDGLDQAVALLTLTGGAKTAAETRDMIAAAPRLRGVAADVRETVFHVLRNFYPIEGGVNALRPDVLGERLIAQELSKDDELLDVVIGKSADARESAIALTVLTRLAHRQPAEEIWLQRGLKRNLADLAGFAVAVAVETGDPIGRLMAETLSGAPRSAQQFVVNSLRPILPDQTIALRELALVVARLHLDRLKAKGKPSGHRKKSELAWAYSQYAGRLRDLDRINDALEAGLRAQSIARDLAQSGSPESLGQLATITDNVATLLGDLGDHEEALRQGNEALRMWGELAPGRSEAIQGKLATSLANRANRLRSLGRYEEALADVDEAVRIQRESAAVRLGASRAELATSLNNRAGHLSDLGRYEEALTDADEALRLRRELAATQHDAFRADLATSLGNRANRLRDLGQYQQALADADEALRIRRELAAERPDAFRADLARSLDNRANHLSDFGRYGEALTDADEALRMRRTLAATRPDAFRADLATSLGNRAGHLRTLGRYAEALDDADEALRVRRDLAAARPAAFRADLAISLSNRAGHLSDLGRYEEALTDADEALRTRLELAAARPGAFRYSLAISLGNRANHLSRLGRDEEALADVDEALHLWRAIAAARPDAFRADLASSLVNRAVHLSSVGRYEEALANADEALRIRRELTAARPDAFRADLATSLDNRANHLRDFGRYDETLADADEALRIRRDLVATRPDAFRVDLATSLDNRADYLSDLGLYEDALPDADAALRIRRELAATRPDAFQSGLLSALTNFANCLIHVGRISDAVEIAKSGDPTFENLRTSPQRSATETNAAEFLTVQAESLLSDGQVEPASTKAALACDLAELALSHRPRARGDVAIRAWNVSARCRSALNAPDQAREDAEFGLSRLQADLTMRPRRLSPRMLATAKSLVHLAGPGVDHTKYVAVFAALKAENE